MKMKKLVKLVMLSWVFGLGLFFAQGAQAAEKVVVTILVASNEGSDFNLDNDEYRDELIKLFSYSSYTQSDQVSIDLEAGQSSDKTIVGDYLLSLALTEIAGDEASVSVKVSKEGKDYVDTTLGIKSPGTAFVGGPPENGGVVILVLERV